jgi:hypothetical protein
METNKPNNEPNLDNMDLQDDKESTDIFDTPPSTMRMVKYTMKSKEAYLFSTSQVDNISGHYLSRPVIKIILTPTDVQYLIGIDNIKTGNNILMLFQDCIESVIFFDVIK